MIMDNKYIIFQENCLFGLKDHTGNIIISPQYIEMYDFKCGLSMVRNEQYEYAYINKDNKQIVSFGKYRWCDPQFVCGFARVMANDKWGIIDTSGNIVVPLKYDKIWTINEDYIFSIKAYIGEIEELLNLNKIQKPTIFDDLKYINVYSVEAFKQLTNCEKLHVKVDPKSQQLFFTYGCNFGHVALSGIPKEPVVAIVSNSSGKIDPLLMEKTDVGKTYLPISKIKQQKKTTHKTDYHKISFWDYEDEKMNDVDNWSDPYDDERAYYGGWSREDVESGLADAYE